MCNERLPSSDMSQTLVAPQKIAAPAARDPLRTLADDVPTALLAQCTCPDWCERDHDRD